MGHNAQYAPVYECECISAIKVASGDDSGVVNKTYAKMSDTILRNIW
jgi:hypothetical protein